MIAAILMQLLTNKIGMEVCVGPLTLSFACLLARLPACLRVVHLSQVVQPRSSNTGFQSVGFNPGLQSGIRAGMPD